MSSIIKSERIRNQSVINLSERFKALHIEYDKVEEEDLTSESHIHNNLEVSALYDQVSSKDNMEEVLATSHQKREEILSEANEAAQKIVEEAKCRAEEILSAALTKAEEIKEETREKQTQLLYETQAKSEKMLEEVNEEVKALKRQAEEEKHALIMSSEGDLVNILQKLLGHIITEEVFENTDWLQCLVRKMIQGCHTKDEIKVCVSQGVFEQLTEDQKKEIQALGEHITIEVRNTLNETTCVVETKLGNISYDVVKGLERVISEIKTLEKLS
nr:hypothetical protein [uncultured Cellulosilyticum sp.]